MKVNIVNQNFESDYVKNLLKLRGVEDVDEYLNPTAASLLDFNLLDYIKEGRKLLQFVLNKDQSYWQAVAAQMGAITARIQVDIAAKDLELKEQELLNQQKQLELMEEQLMLLREQMESQRAQTLDLRSDGAAVAGLIRAQKNLYLQQIDSYKRDAETKLGKMLIDTWTTQKTVDEGLTAPSQVNNASLDTLIANLRNRNTI